MTEALRSIAVFGGGVVALSAATAFARALPGTNVRLLATPVDAAAFADHLPVVWPSSAPVLDRLGLDERALIERGAASPRLAQRFTDWSRDGEPWLVAEGDAVTLAGPGQPHQRWLDAARAGTTPPFHALLPAAVMAETGRSATIDGADHAMRVDPAALAGMLAERLRHCHVRAGAGSIAAVERDERGGIAAVQLADGGRITADLFVDATGPEAALGDENEMIEWSSALPCDRLLIAADRAATPPPLDNYRATEIGWSARWPWPAGGLRALGYAAGITGDDRARRTLPADRDGAVLVACRPGRRRDNWRGNVLALGEAAAQPGPLAHGGFTLALAQLALALDLLPGRDMEPLLIAEYNRRAGLRADRMRDYLATFYHAGGRRHGSFWEAAVTRPTPSGLAAALTQYARRGLLPHHDEESVRPDTWHAVLLGQGIRPERRDPVAMAVDPATNLAAVQRAVQALRATVDRLPRPAAANRA